MHRTRSRCAAVALMLLIAAMPAAGQSVVIHHVLGNADGDPLRDGDGAKNGVVVLRGGAVHAVLNGGVQDKRLVIEPGAVVKVRDWIYFVGALPGLLQVEGATITCIYDDTVGGDTDAFVRTQGIALPERERCESNVPIQRFGAEGSFIRSSTLRNVGIFPLGAMRIEGNDLSFSDLRADIDENERDAAWSAALAGLRPVIANNRLVGPGLIDLRGTTAVFEGNTVGEPSDGTTDPGEAEIVVGYAWLVGTNRVVPTSGSTVVAGNTIYGGTLRTDVSDEIGRQFPGRVDYFTQQPFGLDLRGNRFVFQPRGWGRALSLWAYSETTVEGNVIDGYLNAIDIHIATPAKAGPPRAYLLPAAGFRFSGNHFLPNADPASITRDLWMGIPVVGSRIDYDATIAQMAASGRLVSAERNYWGHESGPRDPSDRDGLVNLLGQGLRVTDGIDYDPWIGARDLPVIDLTPDDPPALGVGGTLELTVRLTNLAGDPLDGELVTLALSDESVARPAEAVVVTGADGTAAVHVWGLTPGEATLTASALGGAADAVDLLVQRIIAFTARAIPDTIRAGASSAIVAEVRDAETGQRLTDFHGNVRLRLLEDEGSKGLARLASTLALVEEGRSEPVLLLTPGAPFEAEKPITDLTALAGRVVVEVSVENEALEPQRVEVVVISPIDVFVERIEIQQGALDPGTPFVAGHPSAVLVHVGYRPSGAVPFSSFSRSGLRARLKVMRLDEVVFEKEIAAGGQSDQTFVLQDTYEVAHWQRLQDVLVAALPSPVLERPGDYYFEAELIVPPSMAEAASDLPNNRLSRTESFVRTPPFRVLASLLTGEGDYVPVEHGEIASYLAQVFPVSQVVFNDPALNNVVNARLDLAGMAQLLDRHNAASPGDQRLRAIFYSDQETIDRVCGRGRGGCAYLHGKAAVVRPSTNATAHELGHTLGLRDTYKTDGWKTFDGPPNPRRPDATDKGNYVEEGTVHLGLMQRLGPVARGYDFMGAAYDRDWTDRQTWEYLFGVLATSAASAAKQASEGPYAALSGTLTVHDAVRLNPIITMEQAPEVTEPGTGPYSVAFLDRNGNELSAHLLDVVFHIPEAGDVDEVPFSLTFPLPAGTAALVFRREQTEIFRRTFSANPPTVSLVSPAPGDTLRGSVAVAWTSADPDGDALTYDLVYSTNGDNAFVVAVSHPGTSYIWDVARIPNSGRGVLTVIASDGVNEARASVAGLVVTDGVATGVDAPAREPAGPGENVQGAYVLSPNYPNPFNPQTTFTLAVVRAQHVRVEVFDLLGRRVVLLHDGPLAAQAPHRFVFDAADLPSGMYLLRVSGETFQAARSVTLLR